jgi:hypothetical protein
MVCAKVQLFSAAFGLSSLMAGSCQALADDISEWYPLNFYDYRQADFVYTGNTAPTLYAFVGGAFYPSSIPQADLPNVPFPEAQAFGSATTVSAIFPSGSVNVPYENSPDLPFEFGKDVPYSSAIGSTVSAGVPLRVNNPSYGNGQTYNFTTNDIPSDIPKTLPFVKNVQVTGSTTGARINWTQPTFNVPADATWQTNFIITDIATKQAIDFFILPNTQTSFDLSKLGTVPGAGGVPSIPLIAGHGYQISVEATLYGNNVPSDPSINGNELSTTRSFANFYPTSAPSPVTGPIYLPNVAMGPSGVIYNFDIDVTEGQSYNIDPASSRGFIYQIGAGDPNFASVDLPDIGNSNPYELLVWNGTKFVFVTYLGPDALFDFAAGGVSEFEVLGIDPSANLPLLNGNAFVTTVTFTGSGTFTGTMTAVVPEPSTWTLLAIGFAGLGLTGWRRRPGQHAAALRPAGEADQVLSYTGGRSAEGGRFSFPPWGSQVSC